ncbi:UNVERIFIED_ORG: hypothetical protein J2X79_001218 [Arthrobacter globiformis]|nr:hypothetical protein [Arthrobacter globiformis]
MKKSSGRSAGQQSAGHQAGGYALDARQFRDDALQGHARGSDAPKGDPLKAMSPGVVDYLFRQLVAGEPPEDVQWSREGVALSAQAPGPELARRLSETDLDALTPTELFHYVRAAQRLSQWAESLREVAVERYCEGAEPA